MPEPLPQELTFIKQGTSMSGKTGLWNVWRRPTDRIEDLLGMIMWSYKQKGYTYQPAAAVILTGDELYQIAVALFNFNHDLKGKKRRKL